MHGSSISILFFHGSNIKLSDDPLQVLQEEVRITAGSRRAPESALAQAQKEAISLAAGSHQPECTGRSYWNVPVLHADIASRKLFYIDDRAGVSSEVPATGPVQAAWAWQLYA